MPSEIPYTALSLTNHYIQGWGSNLIGSMAFLLLSIVQDFLIKANRLNTVTELFLKVGNKMWRNFVNHTDGALPHKGITSLNTTHTHMLIIIIIML